MTSRFRLGLVVGVALTLSGCGDAFDAGPIEYKPDPRAMADLKDKPKLREGIREALAGIYGPSPRRMKVPAGSGLPEGGRRLANREEVEGQVRPVVRQAGEDATIAGGYALYRRYCLHCHGIQGGGDGPTAAFLFPRPRDFRPGKFKFTSVAPSNPKPTRSDLRKTVLNGLHGTSMPAFEALMTRAEVERVVDYVVFLSMRGETELALIDEAKIADADDPAALPEDVVKELSEGVIEKWKSTESLVVAPKARRTPPTRESVLRGRDIFLAVNATGSKTECVGCHGVHARGDGASFIEKKVFDKVVFGGKSIDEAIAERYREVGDEAEAIRLAADPDSRHGSRAGPPEPFDDYKGRLLTLWTKGSLDDWGDPLRPADLTKDVYKGGRRPIDLYWRISKGINGAKMPAHASLLPDDQIWDVVNFVLALPYEPGLLADAEALKRKAAASTATASVASAPR